MSEIEIELQGINEPENRFIKKIFQRESLYDSEDFTIRLSAVGVIKTCRYGGTIKRIIIGNQVITEKEVQQYNSCQEKIFIHELEKAGKIEIILTSQGWQEVLKEFIDKSKAA